MREGFNQIMREEPSYIGFLMILMQRLVVSSTRAIRTILERRLEALAAPQEQLTLFPMVSEEDWADLDSQEQLDILLRTWVEALKNERAEVKLLLEAAKRCESQGPDAKAEALLDWIYRLQAEEGEPELKVLVFTEFVPTQEMLYEFLTERGFKVVPHGLAMHIPPFIPGQPIPIITLPGLAPEITGFWSLWQISVISCESRLTGHSEGSPSLNAEPEARRRRIMPLFLADDGRMLAPTARYIWDQLLTTQVTILRHLDMEISHQAFDRLRGAAEQQGKTIYDELVQAHREHLLREREKGEYAFAARRRAIERIGLRQVRNHRLSLLEREEEHFREQLERRAQAMPEMKPLLIVRVEGGAHG